MVKRILVAGCRDYAAYEEAEAFIGACLRDIPAGDELIFLSGGCRGADRLGERYAREHGYPVERYPADWRRYGKGAGLRRNRAMAEVCDRVICFWDGKSPGTASLIACARKLGKPLYLRSI